MNETDLLNHVCKTTDMGRFGITNVLPKADDPQLRQALGRQRAEYGKLYQQAKTLLAESGQSPKPTPAMAKMASSMSSSWKTRQEPTGTKIAELMIRGSVLGEIKSLRYLRTTPDPTTPAGVLTEKLLKTQQDNIEQMKVYL